MRGALARSGRVIVLIGAGHAHVEVLRSFAIEPVPGIAIILVTRTRFAPYSGMLPGLVAGLYKFEEAHVDAQRLAAAAGAQFIMGTVVGLDLTARQIRCADGRTLGFDILSLDIGITPATGEVPGAAEHAISVKPIDGFLPHLEALLERVRTGSVRRVALVGGGAGGVEMALAVAHRLQHTARVAGHDPAIVNLALVTRAARIVPALPIGVARRLERHLSFRRIGLLCGARVTAVSADHLRIDGRPPFPAEAVLWVTEAAAPGWLHGTGLPLDRSGFIAVGAALDVPGHPGVFATGDVVRFGPRDLPKAGVYAVRQGPVLVGNIRRAVLGKPPRPYRPQRETLVLISTGDQHAVGTRNGVVVEGDWVWRIKDWLDRRWMKRYQSVSN